MKNRLYGIGEPLTMRALRGDFSAEKAVKIMAELGVTSMREWLGLGGRKLLLAPDKTNEDVCRAFDKTFALCEKYDIEVTCIGGWYTPEGLGLKGSELPARDMTEGSAYRQILEATEIQWETIARRFPQVKQWETGNEWNFPLFLHPPGWKAGDKPYSLDEMMLYACDLMYVAARGIRRGNPEAKVVSFSPTPDRRVGDGVPNAFGIAWALDTMYRHIEEGHSFSTNSDDYFDMVAWHPYLSTQMGYAPVCTEYPAKEMYHTEDMPDALWKAYNDMAYHVMAKHGDGHKKVLLTEFGFSDCGDPEREKFQATLIPKCYELLKQMPYVKSCHFFRLFEEENSTAATNGVFTNESEAYFGIVREPSHDYTLKERALALQKVYLAED